MGKHYLHIRMDLVKKYTYGASSQEVKAHKETLCFAIWCKMQRRNSVIFNLTIKDVKKKLGVGYPKARKLLKDVKEDGLFTELGNGRFIVNTFRDKEKKSNKKGGRFQGAYVCRIPISKDYKLKELYSIVNNILYTSVISGARQDCFNVGNNDCAWHQLTTNSFAKVVNMGHGSICRIKKNLISEGKIKSTYAEMHMADDRNEGEMERTLQRFGRRNFTFNVGNLHYLIIPCSYSFGDRETSIAIRHRIYGYKLKGHGAFKEGTNKHYNGSIGLTNMPD